MTDVGGKVCKKRRFSVNLYCFYNQMISNPFKVFSLLPMVFCLFTSGVPVEDHITDGSKPKTGNLVFSLLLSATPDTICAGMTSQLSATPVGGEPPFTFLWSPETGLDDPASQNPKASPTATIRYTVVVTDAAMQTATDSIEIFVKGPPETPGPIAGLDDPCKDSTETYTIAEVYGSTSYSWTVPEGNTIVDGQNTRQVKIKWSGLPGAVSVIAGNECGNSNPSLLSVTLNQLPVITGDIEGPESACEHEQLGFYVAESPGTVNYLWTVPADAEINDGQGTDSITVTWGSVSGDIMVMPENQCGSGESISKSVSFENIPVQPGIITGDDTVCINHSGYVFSVSLIPETISYQWTLPEGAIITDGEETHSITVSFGLNAVSGTIHVYGENRCGKGAESFKEIVTDPCAGTGEAGTKDDLRIYPNPAGDEITITVSEVENQIEITIRDITGKVKLAATYAPASLAGNIIKTDISRLVPGIYFLHLKSEQRSLIRKLIVQ